MSFKMIVLAKQVPDTRNVGKDAMKADGTINRAVLPAIFNPEDLNALEQALRIKDKFPGSTITVLTMGPGRASDVLRDSLFRGADDGVLLSDRAFAGADTLATSYALSTAIKKIKDYDLILGGRQAIDGDTAQVGPQVAEKLGLPQITYSEEILEITADQIKVRRLIKGGVEVVTSPLPCLVTITGTAGEARPQNAKRVMQYKNAVAVKDDDNAVIKEWDTVSVNADIEKCGLSGSPTRVKHVENIIFQAKDSQHLGSSDKEIEDLIVELLNNHTIG